MGMRLSFWLRCGSLYSPELKLFLNLIQGRLCSETATRMAQRQVKYLNQDEGGAATVSCLRGLC